MSDVREKLKDLPKKPGVYLFKGADGRIIYIGKAKNLKNRVRSYFIRGSGRESRTEIMIREIQDLEYRVVSSEIESLILENILIKQEKPRYNVSLRDDKNYQFIKLDYAEEIPQIYTVRKLGVRTGKNAKYFGPYTSGLSVRSTLNLIKRIFRLCRNKKIGKKPCFAYHLGRCLGVCIDEISVEKYKQTFKQIEHFLAHRQTEILRDLKNEMKAAASKRQYERAAVARDKIRALEHLWERQKIVSTRNENQDFLGIHRAEKQATVTVLLVRAGKLINQENFTMDHNGAAPEEVLEKFLVQYYAETSEIPREIFVPENLLNSAQIERALTRLRGTKVKVLRPTRGKKRKLVELAKENAEIFYQREMSSFSARGGSAFGGENLLEGLKSLLKLPTLPRRIEGYDISNIQGTNPVGSMVVFTDARPDKSQYRKFKINVKDTPDDFAMMREVLNRRFRHHITLSPGEGREGERSQPWPAPDLIVIDGGKGQLNVAVSVLKAINYELPVIGLAKRLEEIFIPGMKQSIILPNDSAVLFLLQQIRDEAHRFAVTFHRSRREKFQIRSRLDEIAGIGPTTRKKLIAKFGSSRAVREADVSAIAEITGKARAKKIKEQL